MAGLPAAFSRGLTRAAPLAVAAVLALFPVAATAQVFGQWSWGAHAELAGRELRNEIGGKKVNDFRQTDLDLSFDLNGYIVHPNVTRFNFGLDALLTEYNGNSRLEDSNTLGLRTEIDILPVGSYPTRLFYRRQRFDFTTFSTESPVTLLSTPDVTTGWGANTRFARGAMRGLTVGAERTTIEFVQSGLDEETRDNQFIDYTRPGKRFNHHIRFERIYRDYATVDLETEDYNAVWTEQGNITKTWRFDMNAFALRQDIDTTARADFSADDLRVNARLFHDIRDRDRLDMSYRIGLFRPEAGDDSDRHSVGIAYRWRPREAWEFAPFTQYAREERGDEEIEAPRAGIQVNWRLLDRAVSALVTGRTSYSDLERSNAAGSMSESQFNWGLVGSLQHGSAWALHKQVEIELASNELRLARDPLFPLPGLGSALRGLRTEDSQRLRTTLLKQWDSRQASVWGEITHRESSGELLDDDFDSDTVSGTAQFAGRRFDVLVNVSNNKADLEAIGEQRVDTWSASARWRPWRPMEMYAFFRSDERQFILTPDIDLERIEAGVRFAMGLTAVRVNYYEITEQPVGAAERTNSGFSWSISRRFFGWLPIVTAPQRRGVIR